MTMYVTMKVQLAKLLLTYLVYYILTILPSFPNNVIPLECITAGSDMPGTGTDSPLGRELLLNLDP